MGKRFFVVILAFMGLASCRGIKTRLPSAPVQYGFITALYLNQGMETPSVQEIDSWYREAAWLNDFSAGRVVAIVTSSPVKSGSQRIRSVVLPGGVILIAGNGDRAQWMRTFGASLFLSHVNPFARPFVPGWLVPGVASWTAEPELSGDPLAVLCRDRRVVFDGRGFDLDPKPEGLDAPSRVSAGFLRYLMERYGESRYYQYLKGAAMDPGSAEGHLFHRMFGIDMNTALAQYCDYLSRGARL